MNDAVASLAAMAHSDRLAAFRLMVRAGANGLASGEIAGTLGVPPTRMSFHLAALERSGLVRSWRDGRNIRYAAQFAEIRDLLVFLTEECCDGHPEICGDLAEVASCGCGPIDAAGKGSAPGPENEPQRDRGAKTRRTPRRVAGKV